MTGGMIAEGIVMYLKENQMCTVKRKEGYEMLKFVHSFCFIMAMFATNWSLLFVSYPVQALAKSCKILPVMMGGIIGRGQNYSLVQYISAILVVTGTIMFNFSKNKESQSSSLFGLLLLFIALLMDGFNGYASEKVKKQYKPLSYDMMAYCNGYGCPISFVLLLAKIAYKGVSLDEFSAEVRPVFPLCLAIGFMSAIGQIFIFKAITYLGVLTLNIITTTRKILTIIFSIIFFQHVLNFQQLVCLVLVIVGASLDFITQIKGKAK